MVPTLVILALIIVAMTAYGWWNGLLCRSGVLSRSAYLSIMQSMDENEGWGEDDDEDEVAKEVDDDDVELDVDAIVLSEDDL